MKKNLHSYKDYQFIPSDGIFEEIPIAIVRRHNVQFGSYKDEVKRILEKEPVYQKGMYDVPTQPFGSLNHQLINTIEEKRTKSMNISLIKPNRHSDVEEDFDFLPVLQQPSEDRVNDNRHNHNVYEDYVQNGPHRAKVKKQETNYQVEYSKALNQPLIDLCQRMMDRETKSIIEKQTRGVAPYARQDKKKTTNMEEEEEEAGGDGAMGGEEFDILDATLQTGKSEYQTKYANGNETLTGRVQALHAKEVPWQLRIPEAIGDYPFHKKSLQHDENHIKQKEEEQKLLRGIHDVSIWDTLIASARERWLCKNQYNHSNSKKNQQPQPFHAKKDEHNNNFFNIQDETIQCTNNSLQSANHVPTPPSSKIQTPRPTAPTFPQRLSQQSYSRSNMVSQSLAYDKLKRISMFQQQQPQPQPHIEEPFIAQGNKLIYKKNNTSTRSDFSPKRPLDDPIRVKRTYPKDSGNITVVMKKPNATTTTTPRRRIGDSVPRQNLVESSSTEQRFWKNTVTVS